MQRKVSIIMPIYNVEKYLVKALDSALNQTYENYEIICIDDGSQDGSGAILDEYAKSEKVKVVHKENTGYGNSMNIGLSMSTGDYISILEPDDYIENDTLESIMSVIDSEGEIDIVKCNFSFIKGEKEEEKIPAKILNDVSKYGRILRDDDILSLYLGYIAHWTAFYRRDFLQENEIKYNETPGASYQDIGMWFQTTMFAKSVYLLDRYLYNYRADNSGSSMNNPNKIFCASEEYDFIEKKIPEALKSTIIPYYVKCRLISVKDNYRRIAREHRKIFLERAAEDFKRIEKNGILDISQVSASDRQLLEQLIESYEKLWNEKEYECQKLSKQIDNVDEFYIYGAGNLATFIYKLLSDSERKKLRGFIVTSNNGEKTVADKRVDTFENIKSMLGDALIIIGVSDLYAGEIEEYLKENGVENTFVFKGGIA